YNLHVLKFYSEENHPINITIPFLDKDQWHTSALSGISKWSVPSYPHVLLGGQSEAIPILDFFKMMKIALWCIQLSPVRMY
ncbi:hypothetical protein ACQP3J_30710, partial [Escherichia coli]